MNYNQIGERDAESISTPNRNPPQKLGLSDRLNHYQHSSHTHTQPMVIVSSGPFDLFESGTHELRKSDRVKNRPGITVDKFIGIIEGQHKHFAMGIKRSAGVHKSRNIAASFLPNRGDVRCRGANICC